MSLEEVINSGERITVEHLQEYHKERIRAEVLEAFLDYVSAYHTADEWFEYLKYGYEKELLPKPTYNVIDLGGKMFTKGSTGSTLGSFVALLMRKPFSATRYMVFGFVLGCGYEALRGMGTYLWEERKYHQEKTAREEHKKHEELIDSVKKTYFAALNQEFAQRLFTP